MQTRINIVTPAFVQPAVGATVTVVMDAGIAWLLPDVMLKVEGGGIYKLVSRSGYNYVLQLKKGVLPEGYTVLSSMCYPVSASFKELTDTDSNMQNDKVLYVENEEVKYGDAWEIGEYEDLESRLRGLLNF